MTERTLICPECGLKFVSRKSDGSRSHCYKCVPAPRETMRGTPCERCGRPCRGDRCARCRVVVECRKCGGEARISGSSYGDPDASACCRQCGWGEGSRPEAKQRKREAARRQHKKLVGERVCAQCGSSFALTYRGYKKGQRFCSHDCNQAAVRAARPLVECRDCGLKFDVPPSRAGKYSRCTECRQAKPSKPKSGKAHKVYFPACDNCGAVFCARNARQRLCSSKCKIDDVGARLNDLYALACQYRRDTGQYLGGQWRHVLYDILRDRDGDKCGICHRKIDFTLKSGTKGNPMGPSIDHIVPRSQGGQDNLANIRNAHWQCNQRRGNRGGNEQLALVG